LHKNLFERCHRHAKFCGKGGELWCTGGEASFIKRMMSGSVTCILESSIDYGVNCQRCDFGLPSMQLRHHYFVKK
jgi:23S rRNA A1618 N6-methylase RlmF